MVDTVDSTAYVLWNRIKSQYDGTKCLKGSISLNGTDSDVRAANELANAGFIQLVSLTKYELTYELICD